MNKMSNIPQVIKLAIIGMSPQESEHVHNLLVDEDDYEIIIYAETGREGIEQCNLLKPDIIIIDRNTMDMSNLKILQLLKNTIPNSHIIMASQGDELDWIRQAFELKASDFLSKPIDKHILFASLIACRNKMGR